MKKKKTVKTRMLSLFLVLLLLTGSVSSVRAEEAAGTEAAGSETTKEQIVESGESVGFGEQGSVPGSAESTEAGQNAEGNTDAEKSDGTTAAKKDEEASSDKNASNQSAVKKEEKAKAASDEDKMEAAGAGEGEEKQAKTGVGLTATLRVDGYGKSVLYPTSVTLPDTYKPLVGEDGYGFTEARVGEDPGYYTPLHLMAQYCVDKNIDPTNKTNGIDISDGFLTNFLGAKSELDTYFMFEVNNICPNDGRGNLYTLVNCPLSRGDNVVVYDWYWSENSAYAYFTEENMHANVGTAFTVTLLSNDGMGYTTGPCQGADILVQQESGVPLSEKDYIIKNKTDENGNTKVTINKTGTYLLTAERKGSNGYHELNRPFAKVKVDETIAMTDKEAVEDAKNKIDLGDVSAVGDNMELPSSGANGTSVTWKLKNEEKDGKYVSTSIGTKWYFNRPVKNDVTLILVATLTKGEAVAEKEVQITLKGKSAKLAGLSVNYGELNFDPNVQNYEVYVPLKDTQNQDINNLEVSIDFGECSQVNVNGSALFGGSASISVPLNKDNQDTIINIESKVSSTVGEPSSYSEITTITVKRVIPGEPLPELPASWGTHLGKENNNSVTDIKTPIKNGELLWQSSNKGNAFFGSPGYPIVVDDKLYVARNSELQVLDAKTGNAIKSVKLAEVLSSFYSYITYGEGKIFVPLNDGSVQCFNAKTLESLFITQIPEKGMQGLSAIHYKNGVIYVGYTDGGNVGKTKGGVIAYKTEDQNKDNPIEKVSPLWKYEGKNGFYGTGAITVEREGNFYVVVGGDDGKMLSFDPISGELKGELQLQGGIRCAVVEAEGYIWTTSYDSKNAGYLYKLAIDAEGKITTVKERNLPSKSTSSPVVVGGKVYVTGGIEGINAKGFFAVYDADLKMLNSVETKGQLRTPTVTTAYRDNYVYFAENVSPGSLYVAKVTENNEITISTLYTPDREDNQNCSMANIVVGPDGTIYYGNDSSYLFAIRGEFGEVPEKPDGGTDPDGGDGGKDDGNNDGSANDNTAGTTPSLKPDKKPTTAVSAQSFAPRKRTVKVNAATKNNASSESNIVNAIQQSYDKKETSLTIKNPPEVVGAEVFKQLARYPEFRLVFDCGAYTLSMKGSDITNVNATLTMKLLEMENTLSEEDAERYGNYQRLMFAQEGPLPGKITVVYKLGEQFEQSKALYLYDLLGNTEAQEVILQKPYSMFVLENGGEFILSDQKVEEAQEAEIVEISEEIKPVNEKTTGIPVWIYLFIGLGAGALISGLITVKVMNARKRKDTWEK